LEKAMAIGNMLRKFSKDWYAVPETGLQTDRHVHHDTLLPKRRGGV